MRDDRAWSIEHYGDIESRLAEIMARAARLWRTPVSRQSIADVTGLDIKTIARLELDTAQSYSYHTLATLCWYFGCQPADLLEYRPPAHTDRPPILAPRITRAGPPAPPPPADLQLINRIPRQLAGYSIDAIVKATDIQLPGATNLTKPGAQRIYRYTLARLCWFLRCNIQDLLIYEH